MAPRLAVDTMTVETVFTSQTTRTATPTLIQTSVTRTNYNQANRLAFFWQERIDLYQAKLKHFTLELIIKIRKTKLRTGKFLLRDICLVEFE